MNRFETTNKQSDSIRSEIDETRHRMDSTIDALTERLKGRHLLDELLGLLRSTNGAGATVKNKVSDAASTTVHAVVDAVKTHPLPVLVVGAGLAWLIYEKQRKHHASEEDSYAAFEPEPRDPSIASESLEYEDYTPGYSTEGSALAGSEMADVEDEGSSGPGMKERMQAMTGEARERIQARAHETKERVQQKAAEFGERAKSGYNQIKQRTANATAQVRERTRQITARTKDQVSRATQEHPLETGLTCLAVGILAGMLTPTPQRVRDEVAPMAQRLKQRARDAGQDIVQRGKRVVTAASEAVRNEAQAQGLTTEALTRHGGRQESKSGTMQRVGMPRPQGDYPGQTAESSPPTPAAAAAMSGDEQRVASDIVQPKPGAQPQSSI